MNDTIWHYTVPYRFILKRMVNLRIEPNQYSVERWLLSMEIRICQLQLKSVHASYFEHADLGMSTSATAKPERTHRQTHSMRFTESQKGWVA